MTHLRTMTSLALACLVCTLACGSSSDQEHPGSGGSTGAAGSSGGPLYAVSADTFSADFSNRTSLLWLVSDLNGGSVDLGSAVQLAGGATIWGVPGTGAFYVVSTEALTVSKYNVTGGMPVQVGGSIGLAGAGVTALVTPQMIFNGASRAFFIDVASAQALELNLDTMSIIRSVDLSSAVFDSTQLTNLGQRFIQRGDKLVTTVFSTSPTYDRVYGTSKLLFFDPTDGSFQTKNVTCGGLQYVVATSNGDMFFSSDPYVASIYLVDPAHNPAPCIVRLPANADEPDTTVVALNDLTGAPTGGLIAGSNDTAFLRVLDPTVYTPSSTATYMDAFSAPAWRTWSIHLGGSIAAEPTDRAPVAGGIKTFTVDADTYENASAADFSSTTLIRTTGAGAPAAGLKMPGVIWSIVRVR